MTDWGAVPDWVEALGTIGAFSITLLLLNGEIKARREMDEERLYRDARRVSTYVVRNKPDRADTNVMFIARVHNAGEMPIYDTTVFVGPFEDHPEEKEPHFVGVVSPDRTAGVELEGRLGDEHFVDVVFTDSAGREWHRSGEGALERVIGNQVVMGNRVMPALWQRPDPHHEFEEGEGQ